MVFGILRRPSLHRESLSIGTRIMLVKILAIPLIVYDSAHMTNITKQAESRLKVAFNAVLRFVYDLGWSNLATPYRKRFKLVSQFVYITPE